MSPTETVPATEPAIPKDPLVNKSYSVPIAIAMFVVRRVDGARRRRRDVAAPPVQGDSERLPRGRTRAYLEKVADEAARGRRRRRDEARRVQGARHEAARRAGRVAPTKQGRSTPNSRPPRRRAAVSASPLKVSKSELSAVRLSGRGQGVFVRSPEGRGLVGLARGARPRREGQRDRRRVQMGCDQPRRH